MARRTEKKLPYHIYYLGNSDLKCLAADNLQAKSLNRYTGFEYCKVPWRGAPILNILSERSWDTFLYCWPIAYCNEAVSSLTVWLDHKLGPVSPCHSGMKVTPKWSWFGETHFPVRHFYCHITWSNCPMETNLPVVIFLHECWITTVPLQKYH